MEIENQVRKFVIDNFLLGEKKKNLKNQDSFLETGVIDSTGVLELVSFLEEEFKIKIEDEELIPDNLDSIEKIVGFINLKKQKNAGL